MDFVVQILIYGNQIVGTGVLDCPKKRTITANNGITAPIFVCKNDFVRANGQSRTPVPTVVGGYRSFLALPHKPQFAEKNAFLVDALDKFKNMCYNIVTAS